ncbi:MAG: hypothetical protein JWQ14_40 [Adhaeribacter sp.]|nr:hypothetical protein [Adhaeribacter sp.]
MKGPNTIRYLVLIDDVTRLQFSVKPLSRYINSRCLLASGALFLGELLFWI